MRILIYIEPHPIRNSFTHFLHIFELFRNFLQSKHADVRVFMNNETNTLAKNIPDSIKNRIILPSEAEDRIIKQYVADWDTKGITDWLSLLKGDTVSEDYLSILHRVWRYFPFDIIIHWGENSAITKITEELPITRIAMELGCTRPPFLDSISMDPFGTNGNSVIARLSAEEIRDAVAGDVMSAQEALYCFSNTMEALPYEQQFSPPMHLIASQIINSKKKYVFFPLQLYDDANLLLFSQYNSLTDVVSDVVPQLIQAGYMVVIKPHPSASMRSQGTFENDLAKQAIYDCMDHVVWCDTNIENVLNIPLIKNAEFIVTVNSSVGFESLYFDKIVIPLGEAIYAPKGVFPSLRQAICHDFDHSEYLKNIGFLRQFFLGGYLIKADIFKHSDLLYHRILTIDWLAKKHKSNYADFAREYYQSCVSTQKNYYFSDMYLGKSIPLKSDFKHSDKLIKKPDHNEEIQEDLSRLLFARMMDLITFSGMDNLAQFSIWLKNSLTNFSKRKEILAILCIVDDEYYLSKYDDVKSQGFDALTHYAKYGIKENRNPRFDVIFKSIDEFNIYLNRIAEINFKQRENIIKNTLSHIECNFLNKCMNDLSQCIIKSDNKIAVVAHLYYADLVQEIMQYLHNIEQEFDLIVTLPDWGNKRIIQIVKQEFPQSILCAMPNRGYDIGPFIQVLPYIISHNYDAVLKIQTKKGYYHKNRLDPRLGNLWRQLSLKALLGDPQLINDIIQCFKTDPDINMFGLHQCYLPLAQNPYSQKGMALARQIFKEESIPDNVGFFAGTMFWARPSCMQPLLSEKLISFANFEPGYASNIGLLSHDIERIFGHLAVYRGGRVATVDPLSERKINFSPELNTVSLHKYFLSLLDIENKSAT